MKRNLALNLFLAFVAWSTFKAGESLLRTAGSQEMYAFYNLEWLYFVVVAFSALGGIALAYAILKAKPWGYMLGFVWLAVGVAHTAFTGIVSYVNKPLMIQITTASLEAKGRDTTDVATFVNSQSFEVSIAIGTLVVAAIMLVFVWQLFRNRKYFGDNGEFPHIP